jgi:hypothetical protein
MKISELEGIELDRRVAMAEGWEFVRGDRGHVGFDLYKREGSGYQTLSELDFSDDWALGGPIIERDQIFLDPPRDVHKANIRPDGRISGVWETYESWHATVSSRTRRWSQGPDDAANMVGGRVGRGEGSKPLIAAMRAYLASKFGEEVPD